MDLTATTSSPVEPLTAGELSAPLLRVELSVSYGVRQVLVDAALEVREGEIVGLVGLSGSGKSTLAMAILGLLGIKGGSCAGSVDFAGTNLLALRETAIRKMRGREIAYVPQSPLASLNPALTLRTQFAEAWRVHAPKTEYRPRVLELLAQMNLPASDAFLSLYPRQLSVGMAQRVLIAMAVLHRPRLLIADEPTSALDVLTQAEILEVFRNLNQQHGTAILYISHDLLSVANLCRRIAILQDGRVVEEGTPAQIFHSPRHAYTRRLVEAIPKPLSL